eukprot:4219082-Lingulodinium_polyedra.AAC.1
MTNAAHWFSARTRGWSVERHVATESGHFSTNCSFLSSAAVLATSKGHRRDCQKSPAACLV